MWESVLILAKHLQSFGLRVFLTHDNAQTVARLEIMQNISNN